MPCTRCYASRNQPPVYADYTTFLAEVASTCNEALLTNYLLEKYKNDVDMKLMLLNQRLESIRLTIFRQTLFADFELRFHEHAEAGNPLTADFLNGLYADMIREYYGPDFELGADDAVRVDVHPPLLLQLLRVHLRHRPDQRPGPGRRDPARPATRPPSATSTTC